MIAPFARMLTIVGASLIAGTMVVAAADSASQPPADVQPSQTGDIWDRVLSVIKDTKVERVIDTHLGVPYVWGASGSKGESGFDCSGFVWRVMLENDMFVKRTTARKLYVSLPPADDAARWKFGTIVFFDDLKHMGIVKDEAQFYHAQSSKGTNLSTFDPYWRHLIYGFRRMPG